MTFFRSWGNIREIKCLEDQNEAVVKFRREQDAFKFLTSEAKIFNRTYILYGHDENLEIPEKLIQERENDISGLTRKPIAVEIKQMKEQLEEASL